MLQDIGITQSQIHIIITAGDVLQTVCLLYIYNLNNTSFGRIYIYITWVMFNRKKKSILYNTIDRVKDVSIFAENV